ncbi:MAG: DUF2119 domain-containing protein [Methanobacteriaceae archaeon]|jgi:hypothetical protein|nr:DUF2119 domain-containing protein [Candidatus Methanorudis spinitermitis]
MSFFKCINKGKGPTKLFLGGVHGNEGKTTINIFRSLIANDFSNGKNIIYSFDETPYISTLKEEYYFSDIGKEIIAIIKKYKPDFYMELHCYNIKNYNKLISPKRQEIQGVPPLIELKNHVLISSVSPLIRKKYFKKETVCKTLEIPCLNENQSNSYFDNIHDYNRRLATKTYLNIVKLIAKSKSREEFEKEMIAFYPKQVELAKKYAKEIFGENYPPF